MEKRGHFFGVFRALWAAAMGKIPGPAKKFKLRRWCVGA
jgi:hypothetical protein